MNLPDPLARQFENETDRHNQKIVFEAIKDFIPEWQGLEFEELDTKSTFDFISREKLRTKLFIDVKVLNHFFNEFSEFFISTNKANWCKKQKYLQHWVIFYFKGGWIRVFKLCDLTWKEKKFRWFDRRAQIQREEIHCFFSAKSFKYEWVVQDLDVISPT